ncbi:MAG: LEA type 2 family protein, partial [Bdellovibrionota bacterium]
MNRLTVAAVVALGLAGLGGSGCASKYANAQKPTLSLEALKIRDVSLSGMKLDAEIAVQNPNDFDIPVEQLDYTVLINNQKLMDGSTHEHLSVPENGSASVHLPLHLDFGDLLELANQTQAAGQKDSAEVKITGTVVAAGHRV